MPDSSFVHAPDRAETLARIARDGDPEPIARSIATEMPIGIEINGLGYAVLFASPDDLADLVTGFALGERLVDGIDDIVDLDLFARPADVLVRLTLNEVCAGRIHARVRHRATDSACGLCGIENLEQAMRPLPTVTARSTADTAAIFHALDGMDAAQPLNARTRSVHAAALCGGDGAVRLVREDIGRHNAFDKLIGAMAAAGQSWDGGFALLSSRCLAELVEKAILANCPLLVTVSAPTSLALDRARAAGLRVMAVARRDAMLECA